MKIVTYITKKDKRGYGPKKRLPKNSVVFLIELAKERYFHYCYTIKESAIEVAKVLKKDGVNLDFNTKTNPENCVHSYIKPEEV